MDVVECLRTRADWFESHKRTGPAYCYTEGDRAIDVKAAEEIDRLRAAVAAMYRTKLPSEPCTYLYQREEGLERLWCSVHGFGCTNLTKERCAELHQQLGRARVLAPDGKQA